MNRTGFIVIVAVFFLFFFYGQIASFLPIGVEPFAPSPLSIWEFGGLVAGTGLITGAAVWNINTTTWLIHMISPLAGFLLGFGSISPYILPVGVFLTYGIVFSLTVLFCWEHAEEASESDGFDGL